jgi:2-amino-4-hydroxy-6-hydroxymethyldihydropteridine diphosphokinase
VIALVALGSNLGDRAAHLQAGLKALEGLGQVRPSPLTVETPDEGGRGPAYLNTVAAVDFTLTDVRDLLEALLRIELAQGRDRAQGPGAPRTLDLDLVAVQGVRGVFRWNTPADLSALGPSLVLELPHPRAFGRSFVREPWQALEADLPPGLHWPRPKEPLD